MLDSSAVSLSGVGAICGDPVGEAAALLPPPPPLRDEPTTPAAVAAPANLAAAQEVAWRGPPERYLMPPKSPLPSPSMLGRRLVCPKS